MAQAKVLKTEGAYGTTTEAGFQRIVHRLDSETQLFPRVVRSAINLMKRATK